MIFWPYLKSFPPLYLVYYSKFGGGYEKTHENKAINLISRFEPQILIMSQISIRFNAVKF